LRQSKHPCGRKPASVESKVAGLLLREAFEGRFRVDAFTLWTGERVAARLNLWLATFRRKQRCVLNSCPQPRLSPL
jgi:hypothetical protein